VLAIAALPAVAFLIVVRLRTTSRRVGSAGGWDPGVRARCCSPVADAAQASSPALRLRRLTRVHSTAEAHRYISTCRYDRVRDWCSPCRRDRPPMPKPGVSARIRSARSRRVSAATPLDPAHSA
jgi:hypothetical protein